MVKGSSLNQDSRSTALSYFLLLFCSVQNCMLWNYPNSHRCKIAHTWSDCSGGVGGTVSKVTFASSIQKVLLTDFWEPEGTGFWLKNIFEFGKNETPSQSAYLVSSIIHSWAELDQIIHVTATADMLRHAIGSLPPAKLQDPSNNLKSPLFHFLNSRWFNKLPIPKL